MYDTIYIKTKLPLNKTQTKLFENIKWDEVEFQTKDFDSCLITYFLEVDGKLYEEKIKGSHERVISEEEEAKIKKQGRFCWPYEFKVKSKRKIFKAISQKIIFYNIVEDIKGNEWWVDFEVNLIDGKIKGKIKLKELKLHRTKKQIEKDRKDWNLMLENEKKSFEYKFKALMNKITFNKWKCFCNFLLKITSFLEKSINKVHIWIIRHLL